MVAFTESTARKDITVKNKIFSIPTPFAAGHVCTQNEANALNQLLAENVRNNIAGKMKAGADIDQAAFDSYVASYDFGVRAVSTKDPVEKIIRELVETKINQQLAAKGISRKAMSTEQYNEAVEAAIEANREVLQARAREILALRAVDLTLAV